ncbi:MAG TPA: branched-chain amino acid ABC transporter permease [Gaiellaceae bacterium]|jgi:ABC-type branched-subunit amino acid transport system permease subunit|nr:branched-chain amino acid ABC transporter permease [Gaiellaceae bacterium]
MSEPQKPREEQGPGAPRVGVDEWVATHEQRRQRAGGVWARLGEAWHRLPPWAQLAVVVVPAAFFPFTTESDYLIRVGINALLFALLALGLNIVVGYAGLLDLGYVAFWGFGAYAYAMLSSAKFDLHLPTVVSLPIVIAASALLGLLLGLPSRRLLGDYLAIVTLFFAQIFITFTTNGNRLNLPWRDTPVDLTGGPNGIPGVDAFDLFGWEATTTTSYFYISLVTFALVLSGLHFLNRSRTGRAWRALREDPLAAEAMTIPVNRLKLLAFMFGAATAGLTGSIFAAVQIGVFPQNFELPLLITLYAMVILGGAGSLPGVVIGAVTITVLLEILRSPDDARLILYAVILLGLVGWLRPWRSLAAVVAGTVVFGFAVHALASAVWPRGVERTAIGGEGALGWAIEHWVLLPTQPGTLANVGFVALVAAILALTQMPRTWRLVALVPTLYLAAFVWENKLVFQPSVTRLLLLGALLVALMNLRPQGLLGTARVEIV